MSGTDREKIEEYMKNSFGMNNFISRLEELENVCLNK